VKTKWPILIFTAGLLLVSGSGSQTSQHEAAEQRHFSAEDESLMRPAAIPVGVQALLLKDESVRRALDAEEAVRDGFPGSWFSASEVHLGSAQENYLVVVGRGPMLGANITAFWIFRSTKNGYEEVLSDRAHDLIVLNGMWKGHRKIELFSATGISVHTVLLRFDGGRYRYYSDKWESPQ
jgi:hypothetical protein